MAMTIQCPGCGKPVVLTLDDGKNLVAELGVSDDPGSDRVVEERSEDDFISEMIGGGDDTEDDAKAAGEEAGEEAGDEADDD